MMLNFKKPILTKYLRAESGIAAIEFCLIAPLMLLIYFGLVDLTALISLNRKITASAAITADLVGQQKTSVLKPLIMDQYNATAMIMSPLSMSQVRVELFGFRNVGGTITKKWHTSNNQGPVCDTLDPDTTNMAPLMADGNDVIVARSCTNYTPLMVSWFSNTDSGTLTSIKVIGSDSFLVRQSITVRPRASLDITCYETTVAAGTVCS